ncbi:MAG: hypothetical protein QW303_05965, partial [Nitrososphaerota archaeon]
MSSLNDLLPDLQIFYQKIYDIYHSKIDSRGKWKRLAKYVHDNNRLMVSIFKSLDDSGFSREIKMDYDSPISNIEKRIPRESDDVTKINLVVTFLHHIIYEMLVSKKNYVYSLNGMEEMT